MEKIEGTVLNIKVYEPYLSGKLYQNPQEGTDLYITRYIVGLAVRCDVLR